MLDIKFIRENPDIVKENIKKKFQDEKLPLVDEVIELDSQRRANIQEADQLRSDRNRLSKQVGMLMGQAKKDPSKLAEAEAVKKQVTDEAERLAALEKLEAELDEKVHHIMLQIPQIIKRKVVMLWIAIHLLLTNLKFLIYSMIFQQSLVMYLSL